MALDPNIILQAGHPSVQLENPLDLAQKATAVRQLQQRAQLQDMEIAQQQATRNAYNQAATTNPDGSVSFDPNKIVTGMVQSGQGQAGYQAGQQFMQNSLAQQKAQMQMQSDRLAFVHQSLGTVNDQASLDQHNLAMKVAGIPNADQTPTAWNDQTKQWIADKYKITSDATQRSKEIDQQTARGEADAKRVEAGLPALPPIGGTPSRGPGGKAPTGNPPGAGGFNPPPKMQQKAVEDYTQAVAGSRQQPDASQALRDIQAGQKLEEITKLAPGGDLNKLNNQQTKLAITELVKMAGGQAPTESELREMTPDNLAQKYSGLIQQWTNKSQPANAGQFIQQGIDYANGIRGLGAQKLSDRANEIADNNHKFLGDQAYNKIKGQIADEFKRNSPTPKAGAYDHLSDDDLAKLYNARKGGK